MRGRQALALLLAMTAVGGDVQVGPTDPTKCMADRPHESTYTEEERRERKRRNKARRKRRKGRRKHGR